MGNFKDLEIFQLAFDLGYKVHKLTMLLPPYEMFEQGRQIRKSSKSIYANIAEGYGRRFYKGDFIKYLVYAQASCDETVAHLEMIHKTHSGIDTVCLFVSEYGILGAKINRYLKYVAKNWNQFSNVDKTANPSITPKKSGPKN